MTISHMPKCTSELYIHILVPRVKKESLRFDFLRLEEMTESFPLCGDARIFDLYYSEFRVRLLSLF